MHGAEIFWSRLISLGARCLAQDLVDLPHGAVNLILEILKVVLATLDGGGLGRLRHLLPVLFLLVPFHGGRV